MPRIDLPPEMLDRLKAHGRKHSLPLHMVLGHLFRTAKDEEESTNLLFDFIMLPSVQAHLQKHMDKPDVRES